MKRAMRIALCAMRERPRDASACRGRRHSERAQLSPSFRASEAPARHSERAQRVEESRSSRSRDSSRRVRASRHLCATCFAQRRREQRRRRGPLSRTHDPTNQLTALLGSASSRSRRHGLARPSASPRDQRFTRANSNGNGISRGAAENSFRGRDRCTGAALLSIHDPKSRIFGLGMQPVVATRSLSVGLCASAGRGGKSHLGTRTLRLCVKTRCATERECTAAAQRALGRDDRDSSTRCARSE
jgi:hypothetical protein